MGGQWSVSRPVVRRLLSKSGYITYPAVCRLRRECIVSDKTTEDRIVWLSLKSSDMSLRFAW